MAGIALLVVLSGFLGEGWVPSGHPLAGWVLASRASDPVVRPAVFPGDLPFGEADGLPEGLVERLRSILKPEVREVDGLGRAGAVMLAALEAEDSTSLETRAGLSLDAFLEPVDGLHLRERLSIWASSDERRPGGFTPFHEGAEQGRHLYVDWGFAAWRGGSFEASLGRIPQVWGPCRYTNLLVSDNSPPMDMLRLAWDPAPWLAFTSFTSTLDSDSGTYLSAHRLDVSPYQWLGFGFSEAILFASEGLELAYMNPAIPWYPVQWNERDDDNAMLAADASVRPFRGLELYGEILVDDLQYQTEWGRPSRLGWTAGAGALAGATAVTAEYTRIDRFVYSQKHSRNFYLHDGDIIGSALGPDCDRITLGVSTAEFWPVTAGLRIEHARHGEGTVYEGYPDSLFSDDAFPSGVVEHSTGVELDASVYLGYGLEAHATAARRWIRNLGHSRGADGEETEAGIEAVARFGL